MQRFKNTLLIVAIIGAAIAGAAVYEKAGLLATADQTVKLGDSVELFLGSGTSEQDPTVGDVQLRWDGTDLDMLPTADDAIFKIGNGTLSMDVWLYGNTASDYMLWDASASSLTFTGAAALTVESGTTFTLGAADAVIIDGDTTNQTQTAGALDINVGTVTADVAGINLAVTQDNGTATGVNSYAAKVTLTQNDADGDLDGVLITAAATANAAAGSYEYAIAYDCAEDTAGACLDGVLITSSGVDTGLTDGIDVSAANITNAINIGANPVLGGNSDTIEVGSTDATFIFDADGTATAVFTGRDDAGASNTQYDTTGAGTVTLGSADVTAVILLPDADVQIQGGATGNVDLTFHDYADTTDDDMAHALLRTNCTDASTGAEDCDFTVGVVEGGAAAETRLNIDADGGITIGSSNTDSITLTTDGAQDADVSLGENAVGADEFAAIAFNVVFCGQLANNGTIFGGPADDSYDGGGGEYAIGGTVCDGLDNATEATTDEAISIASNNALKVSGMLCKVSSSGSSGVTLTLRSAEANLTPSLACTIATGNTTCSTAGTASTTDIAAGATMAVQAVDTEDLSLQDFWCLVTLASK